MPYFIMFTWILEVHAIGLLFGFLYLGLDWLVMKNEFAFFFLNWQFSKSANVCKSSSFVKLFCGLLKNPKQTGFKIYLLHFCHIQNK